MKHPRTDQNCSSLSHDVRANLKIAQRFPSEKPSWWVKTHRFHDDLFGETEVWNVPHGSRPSTKYPSYFFGDLSIDFGMLG